MPIITGEFKKCDPLCGDTLHKLAGFDVHFDIPERYAHMWRTLSSPGSPSPMWSEMMPTAVHGSCVNDLVTRLRAVNGEPLKYFTNEYQTGSRFLASMQKFRVSSDRIAAHRDKRLGTFVPDRAGFVGPIVYDRFSRTGRLRVVSGPRVLELPREFRDIYISRYPRSRPIYMDFSSMEIRVILAAVGRPTTNEDVYESISRDIFNGTLDRSTTKQIVISMLYGMGSRGLVRRLECTPRKLDTYRKGISKYFALDEFLTMLLGQQTRTGRVINGFGRPVMTTMSNKSTLLNYYAQSTAVDVALLGFAQIMKRADELGLRVNPQFVIHDAFIVDIDPPSAQRFVKIVRDGFDILGGHFPLAVKLVHRP